MQTLRLYVLADIHSPDYFVMPEISADQYDMVLTLGDIDEGTLDYIIHMSREVPIYGVPGNHDRHALPGVTNLHGKVIEHNGIRIGGIGGARKYKNHPYHYTEREMASKMRRLAAADIIISHAPPLLTSLKEDPIHQGFPAFDHYILKHSPQYWIHGHLSKNLRDQAYQTKVIGVRERMPLQLSVTPKEDEQKQDFSSLLGLKSPNRSSRLATLLTLFFPK
ncbi:MAG: metallophosphoesterase [Chloroflexota bacterium]